jgi:peptidoglycan/LPS O-acetylase OafA/YrhL
MNERPSQRIILMLAAIQRSIVRLHDKSDSVRLPAYSVHMDAIRAIAAFLVLAGHSRMLFFGDHQPHHSNGGAPTSALGLGGQAVIVFFVLSGFLVGSSAWRAIEGNRWSWNKYLFQRMTRLWIVLIPALIFGGILDHIGLKFLSSNGGIYSAPPGQGMVEHTLTAGMTLKVLIGNALFLQKILVPSYGTNAALWSLANEFWYYMLFPLLLLLFNGRTAILLRVLYGIIAAFILALIGIKIASFFLVWLFGFGISMLELRIPSKFRQPVTVFALLQFLAVIVIFRRHQTSYAITAGSIGISFAVYLYVILHARQPVGSFYYQKLATTFSKFSYTLYLTHLPFLVFLVALINRPWHPWPKTPAHFMLSILLVVVTYLYAWMMYLFFERNTDAVRNRLTQKRSVAAPVISS